jgi:hypothetical protein
LTPLEEKCKAAYDAKIAKIMGAKQSRDSVSFWDIEQRLCKLGLNNKLVDDDDIQAALENYSRKLK